MKRTGALLIGCAVSVCGQRFDLGKPVDPCAGGVAYTVANPPPAVADVTLRYSSGLVPFTCTVPAPSTPYLLTLSFVEPSVQGPGQRSFSVFAGDVLLIDRWDLWAACGALKPCSRVFLLPGSAASLVELRFVAQIRNALISSVTITPLGSGPPTIYGLGLESITIPTDCGPEVEVKIDTSVVALKP